MTIITKPSNDKNAEKLILPLFTEGVRPPSAPSPSSSIGDLGDARIISHRKSPATTIFLFLSALAVMLMGVLGGIGIYRLYAPSQADRMRFHGYCGVPYDSQAISEPDMLRVNSDLRDKPAIIDDMDFFKNDDTFEDRFFREEFELDLSDNEQYSKINVPLFKGGRRGRFIHDFKINQTGIIDSDTGRCFIMPLDRETVLPPKSLYDLLTKMWDGYYNIDTERVRKDFRVVMPELTDMSVVSPKVSTECEDKKVYLLQKYDKGIFKRDVHINDNGKFGGFAGKHIVEFDIVNINEIEEHEKKTK